MRDMHPLIFVEYTGFEPINLVSQTNVLHIKTNSPFLSERRGLNPQPPPWQGGTLPIELLSHNDTYLWKTTNYNKLIFYIGFRAIFLSE